MPKPCHTCLNHTCLPIMLFMRLCYSEFLALTGITWSFYMDIPDLLTLFKDKNYFLNMFQLILMYNIFKPIKTNNIDYITLVLSLVRAPFPVKCSCSILMCCGCLSNIWSWSDYCSSCFENLYLYFMIYFSFKESSWS